MIVATDHTANTLTDYVWVGLTYALAVLLALLVVAAAVVLVRALRQMRRSDRSER